mmetsp:Transcript_41594/g.50459  ORF Transcript_41594/g.50459 Transcript_41594/m.50459 type:complete len:552 (-) Transcript_41594:220-1875(-)|eukprot:CAMPEP_0197851130 /NCGR_PEP_ID=MMETSP1438-20131217/17350_1 /TAXON_ID=1461541 /ORGANISM="Pterosperma sp., Strain CCMP1384" /LENGTH=551 /DNA_ID=CAMNT_0043464623 /DNA_START=175 /DNA_END=1830 /DNA_ORIENTATION=+
MLGLALQSAKTSSEREPEVPPPEPTPPPAAAAAAPEPTPAAPAPEPAMAYTIDAALVDEAKALDASDTNRSNINFSYLSQKIAKSLMAQSPALDKLEEQYVEMATAWNKGTKPPFCCVEGVKYAIDAVKWSSIQEPGHVVVCVPFYMEFERGAPATAENPNGEESPIQKIDEALFLLENSKTISMDLVFINDSIAEKQDNKDGGSVKLFKSALLDYTKAKDIAINLTGPEDDFESFTALDGLLTVKFTSVGGEAAKGSKAESPEEKTKRLENRGEDGKLRERKGGAVLAGLEIELPSSFADKPQRTIRCLVDGDSAHPIGSFIGDAAYSVLQLGHTAYLGNLKSPHTCVSIVGADAGGGDEGTQARVQNRKLFFSGFVVPFLFPELTLKYKYTGTTQLPVKAIRGDIDFAAAKLPTVQPNVDLGILALVCSFLNANGGSIDSGAVTIRDNVASSTMTSSDLTAEWTKTYGPIFTSAVGLCRDLKPDDFAKLPGWLTTFIEGMEFKHYEILFGGSNTPEVDAIFATMKKFRDAPDREAVLAELEGLFGKVSF